MESNILNDKLISKGDTNAIKDGNYLLVFNGL